MGILHPHGTGFDAPDAPGRASELENVTRHALDREVLVYGTDERVLGLEDDPVVRVVRNGAAGRDGQHPRAPPPTQAPVDRIVMDACAAPAAARGESARDHLDDLVVRAAVEIAIRMGSPQQREELVGIPILTRGLGHDLLGEDVERRFEHLDAIELAFLHRPEERRALQQLVTGHREKPPLRRAVDRVSGPPHALQEGRNAPGKAQLTDQVDVPYVDAELERRRRDQRFEVAALETPLGVEPPLFRHATVVRRNRLLAQTLAQPVDGSLGLASRVNENERRRVLLDEGGDPVVDLLPNLTGQHRFEGRARQFECHVPIALVAFVDDAAIDGEALGIRNSIPRCVGDRR